MENILDDNWKKYFSILEDEYKDINFQEFLEVDNITSRNNLVLALSMDRFLWQHVDKVYNEDKNKYYESYLKSIFKDLQIKFMFSIQVRSYIEKVAGIEYWCRENNDDRPILKLIQKGYNSLYRMFKLNPEVVDIGDYIKTHLNNRKNVNKKSSVLNPETFLSRRLDMSKVYVVSEFLSNKFQVSVEGLSREKYLDIHVSSISRIDIANKVINKQIENIKNGDDLDIIFKNLLGVKYNDLKKVKNLEYFLDLIDISQILSCYNSKRVLCTDLKRINLFDNVEDIKNKFEGDMIEWISNKNQIKISRFMRVIINDLGMLEDMANDIYLDENIICLALVELINYMKSTYGCFDIDKLNEFNIQYYFLSTVFMMAFINNYKNLNKNTFGISEEENFYTIKSLKSKIESLSKEKQILEDSLQKNIENKNLMIKSLLNDIDVLKKENKKMLKEINKIDDYKKELFALREYAYEQSVLAENEVALTMVDLTLKEKVDKINEKNIVIFGGHPNWVNNLKKYFPNQKFVDIKALSSTKINFIDNKDLIVVCTNVYNHGWHYKINSYLSKHKNTELLYVDDINQKFVIDKIYKKLFE